MSINAKFTKGVIHEYLHHSNQCYFESSFRSQILSKWDLSDFQTLEKIEKVNGFQWFDSNERVLQTTWKPNGISRASCLLARCRFCCLPSQNWPPKSFERLFVFEGDHNASSIHQDNETLKRGSWRTILRDFSTALFSEEEQRNIEVKPIDF